jgi:hypothetical protein
MLKEQGLVAKSIPDTILNTHLVFKHKGELLELVKPTGMFGVELLLGVKMPKRIVASKEDKLSVN